MINGSAAQYLILFGKTVNFLDSPPFSHKDLSPLFLIAIFHSSFISKSLICDFNFLPFIITLSGTFTYCLINGL